LSIENIIGQGKYGIVYKAKLVRAGSTKPDLTGSSKPDQTGLESTVVAVKVFAASQKKAFVEEREVYEVARLAGLSKPDLTGSSKPDQTGSPSMTSSVLQYFGSGEGTCISGIVCVRLSYLSY
jgi:hypothetical protein